MARVMVTITSQDGAPTVAEVRARYGLAEHEVDERFGVVEIEPGRGVYTIRVDQQAAGRIESSASWDVEGPFSDPRVEPFGPPVGPDPDVAPPRPDRPNRPDRPGGRG